MPDQRLVSLDGRTSPFKSRRASDLAPMLPLRDGRDAGGWEWRRECSVSERHDEHRRQAIDQVAGKGHVRLDFDSPPFGGRDSKDLLEGGVLV